MIQLGQKGPKKTLGFWHLAYLRMPFIAQLLCHVRLFATPWTPGHQASLFFTISQSLLKLNIPWVYDATQPSHPLSSPSSHALNLSPGDGISGRRAVSTMMSPPATSWQNATLTGMASSGCPARKSKRRLSLKHM